MSDVSDAAPSPDDRQRVLRENFVGSIASVLNGGGVTCRTCAATVDVEYVQYHIAWHEHLGHEVAGHEVTGT